jgi:hypothetical protein
LWWRADYRYRRVGRLKRELAEGSLPCAQRKRIRKKLGIKCKQNKRFKATTDSRHNLPVAENLLNQRFEVDAPNKMWVSDITYIPTDEGWLYLAGHKDICSGRIFDSLPGRFSVITFIRIQKALCVIGLLGNNRIKHGFQLAHIMPVGPGYDDRQRDATPVDDSMPLAAIFPPYL